MELEKKDPRDLIIAHLHERGLKKGWLKKKIGLSDCHFSLVLNKKRDLTDENLKKINEILGTNF